MKRAAVVLALSLWFAVPVMAREVGDEEGLVQQLTSLEAQLAETHAKAVVEAKKFDTRHKNTVLAMHVRRGQLQWAEYRDIECRRQREMTLDEAQAKTVYLNCMVEKAGQRLAELRREPN